MVEGRAVGCFCPIICLRPGSSRWIQAFAALGQGACSGFRAGLLKHSSESRAVAAGGVEPTPLATRTVAGWGSGRITSGTLFCAAASGAAHQGPQQLGRSSRGRSESGGSRRSAVSGP